MKKTSLKSSEPRLDQGLLLVLLFLIGLGVVQVYSSSYIFAIEQYGDGLYFFKKQAIYACLGVVALVSGYMVPWKHLRQWGWMLWVIAVVGIGLTFVPGLGIKSGGAVRWLQLPMGFRFEPGELLKLSFPFVTAYFLCMDSQKIGKWKYLIWTLITVVPLFMVLKQPDFGTIVICCAVFLGTIFVYGMPLRYLLASALASVPAFYLLVWSVPYRQARILAFLDPWADPAKKGFQVIQSMLSFHSGGIWGAGLGQGQGKLFF
ncbi:MAG: FtsW/RodA/SpoVE family cell cycle protein, partial [Bdellovibrionales bacterium]|nr:FtsW/RodA/SpoVE family cell cycle protein [Bdellovibrionales bacterium]